MGAERVRGCKTRNGMMGNDEGGVRQEPAVWGLVDVASCVESRQAWTQGGVGTRRYPTGCGHDSCVGHEDAMCTAEGA